MKAPLPRSRIRLPDERLAEILDVAAEIFLAHGYAAASTNEIACKANASKGTFYSRFPNKEALFLAVLQRRVQSVFAEVAGFLPAEPPIEDTLHAFGIRFTNVGLSSAQIRLLRVVSMEAENFPQLSRRFFELGPQRAQEALTAYMEEQIARGRLTHEDPALMAQQFLSLLRGGPVQWVVLGVNSEPLGKVAREQHIGATLRLFLRGYGARPDMDSRRDHNALA